MPYRPEGSEDDVINSDLITVDERQFRAKMAVEQVRFYEELEKTVSDPEWAGKDHPFVKRQGRTDFEIGFRLKIKAQRDALAKELSVLNKALEEDLDLPEDDDDY
jgi:hypothetical protein